MTRQITPTPALALCCAALLTACGSGWSPVFSDSSSSSTAPPRLAINSRIPELGAAAAEPDALQITFSRPVELDTVRLPGAAFTGSPSISMYEEGDFTDDVLTELVREITLDSTGTVLTLELALPLRLLGSYHVRIADGAIKPLSGRVLENPVPWDFTVRDGQLDTEALTSFLQPTGSVRYLDDLSAAVIIEGQQIQSNGQLAYVIGFSKAAPDGDFGIPVVLRNTTVQTNQNGLSAFEGDAGGLSVQRFSVAWQEGKPFGNAPQGDLFVSTSDDGGVVWNLEQLDAGLTSTAKISWPVELKVNGLGDLVTAWWAFEDATAASIPRFDEYETFSLLTNDRLALTWGGARPLATPPAGREFGWPYLASRSGAVRVWALWPEAQAKDDLFDVNGQTPEDLTGYWLAAHDAAMGGWLAPRKITGLPAALPRPTDFVLNGNDQGVVLARTPDAGPRAFLIDLASASLASPVADVTNTYAKLAPVDPDAPQQLPSGKGSFNRSMVKRSFPKGFSLSDDTIPAGDRTILVSWQDDAGQVLVSKFDTTALAWTLDRPVPASGTVVSGPGLVPDGTGTLTMVWEEDNGTERAVHAARGRADTLEFRGWVDVPDPATPGSSITVPATDPTQETFRISDPTFTSAGPNFAVHATGRILFSWAYRVGGLFQSSGIRRFH